MPAAAPKTPQRRPLLVLLAAALAGLLWLTWPGRPESRGQPAAGAPQASSQTIAAAAELAVQTEPERAALESGAKSPGPLPAAAGAAQEAPTSAWLALPCSGTARRSGPPMGSRFDFSGQLLDPVGAPLPAGTQLQACLSYTVFAPKLELSTSYAKKTDLKVGDAGAFTFSIDAGSAAGRQHGSLEFWYGGPGDGRPWSARLCLPELHVGGDFEVGILRLLAAPILVAGKVVDALGRPVPNVPVRILSATAQDRDGRDPRPSGPQSDPLVAFTTGEEVTRLPRVRSGTQGEFVVHGELGSPLFLVGARHEVTQAAVWARPGDQNLILRLDLPQTLSGVVRVAPGVPPPQQIYVVISQHLAAREVGSNFEEDPSTIREALSFLPAAENLPVGDLRAIKLHYEAELLRLQAAAGVVNPKLRESQGQLGGFPALVLDLMRTTPADNAGLIPKAQESGFTGVRTVQSAQSAHTWNQNSYWGPAVSEFTFDFGNRPGREYRLELVGVYLGGPPHAPELSYRHNTLWIRYDPSEAEPPWRSQLVLQ